MIDRRRLLFGAAVSLLFQETEATAAGRGLRVEGGRSIWTGGGRDKYEGDLAQALELLGVPMEHRPAILLHIEPEGGRYARPDRVERIAYGQHFPEGMVFGRAPHYVVTEVEARPDATWSTDIMDVYVVTAGGQRYTFGKPHVCGNWVLVTAPLGVVRQCRCRDDLGDICPGKK